ncbi:unnamed protein product, partial [Arabidopsis halleri]
KVASKKKVSPYALFASDNPGALISSVQLNGENYNEWATEMRNALQAKRKIGFIDGTIEKPPPDSDDLDPWKSVNSMIVGWIRSSIEPKVRSTVTYFVDAHSLWVNLQQRFSVGNKVRVYEVKARLASCRQEGLSVMEYYGRLCSMWEEIQTYKLNPLCTCGAGWEFEKEREEEKVHQFIMGLDDARYGNIVTSIIGTDPLPDLATVYQKVIREEQRLKAARVREQGSEAVGFVAKKDVSQESLAMVARFEASSGQSQRRVVCSNCGRTGHEKANCWQLVGFPEWYTERGKSSTRGASRGRGGYHGDMSGGGRGRGTHTAHATTSNSSVFPDFTPDQLRALSQLIQERTTPSNDKLSGKLYGDLILDTGASHHMTGVLSFLEITSVFHCPIGFADGSKTYGTHIGTMKISDTITLSDVLFVPNLNCSLISVSKLLRQTSCFALLTDTLCILQDRFTRTLIGAGEERDGVYYFKDVMAARVNKVSASTDQILWHRRLGHPSFSVISALPVLPPVS